MALNENTRLGASGASGKYEIKHSLRFRRNATTYLTRTPGSAGNREQWTVSLWLKRGHLDNAMYFMGAERPSSTYAGSTGGFDSGHRLKYFDYDGSGSYQIELQDYATYADTTAWYHIVYAVDTTLGTNTDRVKFYVNGTRVTWWNNATWPAQNFDTNWMNTEPHYFGMSSEGDGQPFDGYLAEIHCIDGQTLAPTAFAETDSDTGSWVPIEYTGTYGSQGFFLNFSDNSGTTSTTMGKDYSGNDNHFTPHNQHTFNIVPDTPTNNFAVLNRHGGHTANLTITEGNLKFDSGSNGNTGRAISTLRPTSGKWYAEVWVGQHHRFSIGIENTHGNAASNTGGASNLNGILVGWDSEAYYNGNTGNNYLGADIGSNDIVMIAMDCDNKLVWVGLDGTWGQSVSNTDIANGTATDSLGDFMSVTAATLFQGDMGIFIEDNSGSQKQWSWMNFGQDQGFGTSLSDASVALGNQSDASGYGKFKYPVPAGFNALCTQNMADPEVIKPDDHFKITTYSGNASTGSGDTITLSSLNFAPAMTWLKPRSYADNWVCFDTTRGAHKTLYWNTNNIQGDRTSGNDSLTAFSSSGWTIRDWNNINKSGETFFSVNWKESAASGFDIVTYEGTGSNMTVSHSLGVAPDMFIVKNLGDTNGNNRGWMMYHTSLGASAYIRPDVNEAKQTSYSLAWNDTAPTSSVISLGGDGSNVNQDNDNFIGYLWKAKDGLSKFGKYTGNGSTNGPFIYTGFKPAFVIVKTTGVDDWNVWNYAINQPASGYNDEVNYWNESNATGSNDTDHAGIFYSNGFKINTSNSQENGNGNEYLYLAWAQEAAKYATAFGIDQT